MEKEKITYYPGMFDLIKGIAVISILFTHTRNLFPKEIFMLDSTAPAKSLIMCLINILSLGNGIMPAFLMVSGFGFRPVNMKKCVKKQAGYLLKPYAYVTVFTTGIHFCSHFLAFRYLPGSVYATLCVLGGYLLGASLTLEFADVVICSIGAVWFLLTLFGAWLLLNFLMLRLPERYLSMVIAALVLTGWVLGSIFSLPYCFSQILVAVGYLYVGWLMKKKNWLTESFSRWKWGAVISLAIISQMFGRYDLSGGIWDLGLVDIIGAGCMGFIVIWISLRLDCLEFPLKNHVCMIGRYSLWIICIHTIENQGLPWYLFAERWPYDLFTGFILLVTVKGMIIYIAYRILRWYNLRRMKKKRKGARHV